MLKTDVKKQTNAFIAKNAEKCKKMQNKIRRFCIKKVSITFLAKTALYRIKEKKMQKSSTS